MKHATLLALRVLALAVLLVPALQEQGRAQDLLFATVDRPPFAMPDGRGGVKGFSIELTRALAAELGREVRFEMHESFPAMLAAVTDGRVDGAVANISITSAREEVMDFTQPIFQSGLQIMLPFKDDPGGLIFRALFRWQVAAMIGIAFAALLGGGMLMWLFERKRQAYFAKPAGEAMFPAFWWALNLVVNGGFEERQPQSWPGRIFAVMLVVSSLFVVSFFVANITALITVQAISETVQSVADLEGRRVATTQGSTASAYLDERNIDHLRLPDLDAVLAAFESGEADAVFFDAPILAWYVRGPGAGKGRLIERIFRPENYGIALPQGSPLREDLNRALLALRESGDYERLRRKWFGAQP